MPERPEEIPDAPVEVPEEPVDDEKEITYVLNTKSKVFHYLSCKTLPTANREDTTMSRSEIINAGYKSCGNCKP